MTRVRSIRGWAWASAALMATATLSALAAPVALRPHRETAVRSSAAVGAARVSTLAFEANHGQLDGAVSFSARGAGYAVTLTRGQAVIAPVASDAGGAERSTLRLIPKGGDPAASPLAEERLQGVVNDIRGADPTRWRSSVPTYAKAGFADVWAGIDVLYYGTGTDLEYDFVLAAGADPSPIRMELHGAGPLRIDDRGRLVVAGADARLVQQPPIAYQLGGDGRRRTVAAEYVLHQSHEVGIRLGGYDRSRPLVVDPVVDLSVFVGGKGTDASIGMAVDGSGSTYLTGVTTSANFPTTSGLDTTLGATADAFVTKMDARGRLVYSTYLGGTQGELGTDIAVDTSGSAYVTGSTGSADFPTSAGLDTTLEEGLSCSPGGCGKTGDAFVTKLDAGGGLVYSTYLGGVGSDNSSGVAVDSTGNAYVTGKTQLGRPMGPVPFPTTPGLDQVLGGFEDAFVTKLGPEGILAYSTYLGGSDSDFGRAVAVDGNEHAYVTGHTSSMDFPTTAGQVSESNLGDRGFYSDAFVTRLAPNGTIVVSTYFGGRDGDVGRGIALDQSGNAYVAGVTYSSDLPTTGGLDSTLGRSNRPYWFPTDSFVAKLEAAGTLVYSTYLGGSEPDGANGIAVDGSGRAYVTGDTESLDFPTTPGGDTSFGGGARDAYVTVLEPDGTRKFSTYLGGSGDDVGLGIGVAPSGRVHVTGFTSSGDLDARRSRGRFRGDRDAFMATISIDPMDCEETSLRQGRPCP